MDAIYETLGTALSTTPSCIESHNTSRHNASIHDIILKALINHNMQTTIFATNPFIDAFYDVYIYWVGKTHVLHGVGEMLWLKIKPHEQSMGSSG